MPASRFYLQIVLRLTLGAVLYLQAIASAQETEPKDFAAECEKGLTIYCLAAGMEETKVGNKEKAFEHFEAACRSHKTEGHLRACTPYLSLARELNRLEAASAPLEERCREGEDTVCFYLAKEYLRIAAPSRAHAHLKRLCREDFPSPDPEDYGSCYHLGDSLQEQRAYEEALTYFKLECDRNRTLSRHSCERHRTLLHAIESGTLDADAVRPFRLIQTIALAAVVLSLLAWGLWLTGQVWAFKLLSGPLPVATLVCWGAWLLQEDARSGAYRDFTYIVPSVLLVVGCLAAARERLQAIRRKG